MTVVGNMMVKYCSVNYIFERLLLLGGLSSEYKHVSSFALPKQKMEGIDIVAYLYYCLLLRIDVTWSV